MKISLIICTYMRPKPLRILLQSVEKQSKYPFEILVIDGSENLETSIMLKVNNFEKLNYFHVDPQFRGLTKQRNFGINQVSKDSEIVAFLDDDVVLEQDYFERLADTFTIYPDALGVGGYIINESKCEFVGNNYIPKTNEFYYDGWKRLEGSRFIARKILGLDSDCSPGFLPEFSHGRSVSFLPPSGKVYKVEQLMGGVSSFRKTVFDQVRFSNYFEGYGLYEDADFTLRVSKIGQLYLNTAAKLSHYHDPSGRPNQFKYGKMVVRNGWYVWKIKNPNPNLKAKIKWHLITILLTLIKLSNFFSVKKKKEALYEATGRITGWFSLIFNKPKFE